MNEKTTEEKLKHEIQKLPPKPADDATREEKKNYSQQLSDLLASFFLRELRGRIPKQAQPMVKSRKLKTVNNVRGSSGTERRMAGGIGAKKVDVTWATEESGLILAISIKTINFRDRESNNFQKNLTNRRGDMLIEAVTLHRRFPYSVLAAFFFLDQGAESDGIRDEVTGKIQRKSTFENAHARCRIFTNRIEPSGRDEQFEGFYIISIAASPVDAKFTAYEVGMPNVPIKLDQILNHLLALVAERNPDFYEFDIETGKIKKARR